MQTGYRGGVLPFRKTEAPGMKPRVCTRIFDYILHQILKMGILFPNLMRKFSGKFEKENSQSLKKAEFRTLSVSVSVLFGRERHPAVKLRLERECGTEFSSKTIPQTVCRMLP